MSVIQAGNTTTTSLIYTGDTTGNLVFTTGGANTVALTIDSNQNITTTNKLAAASMPTGCILQVVQASYSTPFSTTSTSYVATGLTASITPKFATSKILAQFSVVCGNGTNQWQYCTLYRNSATNIVSGNGVPSGYLNNNAGDYLTTLNAQILDTPATTAATTYTLYTKCTGGNTIRCFVDSYPAYITLMEIAG